MTSEGWMVSLLTHRVTSNMEAPRIHVHRNDWIWLSDKQRKPIFSVSSENQIKREKD